MVVSDGSSPRGRVTPMLWMTGPAPEELRMTAYHEAGHAVLALLHGRPVEQVTIRGTRFFLGKCEMDRGRFGPRQDELEAAMLILLGGMAAEARLRYPLNLGDCFAYALAVEQGTSILTLDTDFRAVDRPVVMPPASR